MCLGAFAVVACFFVNSCQKDLFCMVDMREPIEWTTPFTSVYAMYRSYGQFENGDIISVYGWLGSEKHEVLFDEPSDTVCNGTWDNGMWDVHTYKLEGRGRAVSFWPPDKLNMDSIYQKAQQEGKKVLVKGNARFEYEWDFFADCREILYFSIEASSVELSE